MIDFNDIASFGNSGPRVDLDAVVARLRDSAEDWVPRLFPSGKKVGKEWRIANIHGSSPGKQGSCTIQLQGDHAGEWYEFDGGKGGGIISAVGHATGLSGRFLIEYAAELVGWKQGDKAPKTSTPYKAKSPEKTNNDIRFILSQCQPAADTLVETYLAGRGHSCPATPDILFHPDLTHWETKMGYPAMVGVVRNAQGGVIGLHRTWLKADGSGKADIQKPKMMLGPCSGGAVHLSDEVGEIIGISEGIETGLAVQNAYPHLSVWAALSTSGMERIVLSPSVRRVVLLADNDKSGAGLKAANATAAKLAAEGRRVWIALPPKEGEDFNDLLLREGAEAVRKTLDAAQEWQFVASAEPELTEQPTQKPVPEIKHLPHKPFGFSEPTGVRPMLRADDGDLARLADACWSNLYAGNDPPWLFRFSMRMTWVDMNDEARPKPQFVTEDRLKYILARQIDWRKEGKEALIPAHPPMSVIKDVLATPNMLLPVLGGIVANPVFDPNGRLVATPGYHARAKLMYVPHKEFVLSPIPAKPTADDIKEARELLLDDLLGDFPFTGDAERAHALALLLLPFMRPMIDGPTPVHLIEKPSAGTGATLMVEAIAVIATGAGANLMSEGRDEDEWRKRLADFDGAVHGKLLCQSRLHERFIHRD
ncbi:MAG: toprim domain-containing protein [Bdellovibrionales bacterium]